MMKEPMIWKRIHDIFMDIYPNGLQLDEITEETTDIRPSTKRFSRKMYIAQLLKRLKEKNIVEKYRPDGCQYPKWKLTEHRYNYVKKRAVKRNVKKLSSA